MKSIKERFVEKVKTADNGCHLWVAAKDMYGYGFFWNGQLMERAHRASFVLFIGPIPDGMNGLHRCDNPTCVNPDHLFIGTHDDNMADKKLKGRQIRGESHKLSKLTMEQVKCARKEWADHPNNQRALARKYGVSQGTMSSILLNKHRALA